MVVSQVPTGPGLADEYSEGTLVLVDGVEIEVVGLVKACIFAIARAFGDGPSCLRIFISKMSLRDGRSPRLVPPPARQISCKLLLRVFGGCGEWHAAPAALLPPVLGSVSQKYP